MEYEMSAINHPDFPVPERGTITKVTFGLEELKTVKVNYEEKRLPAKVKKGDTLTLEWGVKAILKTESNTHDLMPSIQPFTGEMWSFLLVNALRFLTKEQRAGLCFDLYCRSEMVEVIDAKIESLKLERKHNNLAGY